jgi:general secretion pathway protein E
VGLLDGRVSRGDPQSSPDAPMLDETLDLEAFERSLAASLIERGKLDAIGLDRATRLRADNDERLASILAKLGLVDERDMADAMAALLGLTVIAAADFPEEPVLGDRVSQRFLQHNRILPVAETADELVLAMADPLDRHAIRGLEMIAARRVSVCVATPADIEAAHARLYRGEGRSDDAAADVEETADESLVEDVNRLRDLASEAPVIRLVGQLIARAIESRASDIHLEPFQARLVVRYRIDGVLREIAPPPPALRNAIVSRIKIMAKLNIAERRLPQDGRVRLAIRGRDFDMRVSTVPTLHGESIAIRILDRGTLVRDFRTLGFADAAPEAFLRVLEQPQGILLVTGPTGSGKTTTLYTCLLHLHTVEKKLFTVEDPIEYQLDGVNQIQVKTQIGLNFAEVLRSVLRQDPDIIMVGEMRDRATADIAIQAALTGHLVLSTLHTNNAASTITRLLDMGVEDYLVTSTLNGALGQRLARKLCEHCREPYAAPPELVRKLRLADAADDRPVTLYRPRGCERCNGSGYFGRIAITELLVMSDAIGRLVLQHAEAREIQRVAVSEGMTTMYEDGMLKARAGVTSIEEVLRVTRDG